MTREKFINTEIIKSIAKDWDMESFGRRLAELSLSDAYDLQQQIAQIQEKLDEC